MISLINRFVSFLNTSGILFFRKIIAESQCELRADTEMKQILRSKLSIV